MTWSPQLIILERRVLAPEAAQQMRSWAFNTQTFIFPLKV